MLHPRPLSVDTSNFQGQELRGVAATIRMLIIVFIADAACHKSLDRFASPNRALGGLLSQPSATTLFVGGFGIVAASQGWSGDQLIPE